MRTIKKSLKFMHYHKGIGYDFQPYALCLLSVNEWKSYKQPKKRTFQNVSKFWINNYDHDHNSIIHLITLLKEKNELHNVVCMLERCCKCKMHFYTHFFVL